MMKEIYGVPVNIFSTNEEGSYWANYVCPLCKRHDYSRSRNQDEELILREAEIDAKQHLSMAHRDVVEKYENKQRLGKKNQD